MPSESVSDASSVDPREPHPATLDELGLVAALPRLVSEWSMCVVSADLLSADIRAGFDSVFEVPARLTFYQSAPEALNTLATGPGRTESGYWRCGGQADSSSKTMASASTYGSVRRCAAGQRVRILRTFIRPGAEKIGERATNFVSARVPPWCRTRD